MEVVYISGPMTGLPEKNIPEFNRVAELLRKKGFEVINPADYGEDGWAWEQYMKKDLSEMLKADMVATLPGWEHSKGAYLEVYVAEKLGMKVKDYRNF